MTDPRPATAGKCRQNSYFTQGTVKHGILINKQQLQKTRDKNKAEENTCKVSDSQSYMVDIDNMLKQIETKKKIMVIKKNQSNQNDRKRTEEIRHIEASYHC